MSSNSSERTVDVKVNTNANEVPKNKSNADIKARYEQAKKNGGFFVNPSKPTASSAGE